MKAAAASLEQFLAHALTLESETLARLEDVAEMMAVHGNRALWQLFAELAEEGLDHVDDLRQRSRAVSLPDLKPWEFEWPDAEPPEVLDLHHMHYLMSPKEALAYVLDCELRAEAYYRQVAASSVGAVGELANAYAEEEAEHAARIRERIASADSPGADSSVDLDPPHTPE